jgi:hypothetical protein
MTAEKPDPTLLTVLEALSGLASLSAKKRADLASAIWAFSRDLGRQPSEIPARTDIVERLGRDLNAARLGITRGSLTNVRSRVRVAMRLTGHNQAARRLDVPLGTVWEELLGLAAEPADRIALKRLGSSSCRAWNRPPCPRQPSTGSVATSTKRAPPVPTRSIGTW